MTGNSEIIRSGKKGHCLRRDLPPADMGIAIEPIKKPDSRGAGLQKNQGWIQPVV